MRIFSVACLLFLLIEYVYSRQMSSPLVFIAVTASLISGNRDVRFYENGLVIPKEAGEVYLSREQLQVMKLDGHRLVLTGPDADWGGPYSGGTFLIRNTDLARLQEVLAEFRKG